MKILYAIQGTGNGHLSRAIEIIPALKNRAEVDVLISGIQGDVELPFPVKYRFKGLSFIFGKNGGIDYKGTLLKNNLFRLFREIKSCQVENYDLIINDFEPVSAWASKLRGVSCISVSHQSALLTENIPMPKHKNWLALKILKYYAPSIKQFGFHFKEYNSDIFLPIIRQSLRLAKRKQKEHYTVYLPAYADEKIIETLKVFENIEWHIFSKHSKHAYLYKNFSIKPIETKAFDKSIVRCRGVICGAGFETPAEALYLKKKLLVIPMKGQYEQHINAAGLADLGVKVLPKFDVSQQKTIEEWLVSNEIITVHYPDRTQQIVDNILAKHIVAYEVSQKFVSI